MTVLRSGSATDVGRVRSSNQDLSLEGPDLFAVADGMGGHAGGEVAARVAVDALRAAFSRQASVAGLRQAVTDANAAVWRQSQIQSELRGMGTTLTAVALVAGADGRDVLALANVGDSRAYVYSGGGITQVTADHSLAEEKVRQGELTEAEAAVHPHRHILTRALGVSSGVEVDLWELHLQAGDRILLCSDGLTNEVDVAQLAEVLGAEPDPTEAARALVAAANEHGGNDNITVVVVDVLVGERGVQDAPDAASWPPAVAGSLAGVASAQAVDDLFVGGSVPLRPPPAPPASPAPLVGPADASTEPGSPEPEDEQEDERPSRREGRAQRRLAGIPRRITFRVVLFAVLLLVVLAAAYGVVRWYATDNWYVTITGDHLAIYQGRSGGLLWFQPTLVDRTRVTTADVQAYRIPDLRAGVQEPSLAAARHYVVNLRQDLQAQQRIAAGQSATTTTTTTTTTTVPTPTSTTALTTTTTTAP